MEDDRQHSLEHRFVDLIHTDCVSATIFITSPCSLFLQPADVIAEVLVSAQGE